MHSLAWLVALLGLCFAEAFRAVCMNPRTVGCTMVIPDAVEALVPTLSKRDRKKAEKNWEAMRACYATEEAAVQAATKLISVILPYGFDADRRDINIAGTYKLLQEMLDSEDEVQEIIAKNPGVLGCVPSYLKESASADDIRRTANVANGIDAVVSPARKFLQGLSWWDEGPERPKVWFQPTEKTFDDGEEEQDDDDDDDEFELPVLTVDGQDFLYDVDGEYDGTQNLLFSMDGEPYGVYDPETKTARKLTE